MDVTWLLQPLQHTAENKHRNTINTRMAHETCVSEAVVAPRCQAQAQDLQEKTNPSSRTHLQLFSLSASLARCVSTPSGRRCRRWQRRYAQVPAVGRLALCSPATYEAFVPRRATVSHRRSSITQAEALLVRYLRLCPSARWLMVFIFRLAVTSDSIAPRVGQKER